MRIRTRHIVAAIGYLLGLAIIVPFGLYLLLQETSGGTGSPEEAARLRAIIEQIADPESGAGCHPEYASRRYKNGEWVLGIGRDSHAFMSKYRGGGTTVLKDSTGQVRCFFGHVCGPGGHATFMRDANSLDDFYKRMMDQGRIEYLWP